MKLKSQILIASLLSALAIILGAFGAHYLKQQMELGLITSNQLIAFDTGVKYQIYHCIAIFICVLLSTFYIVNLKLVVTFFLIGIILFSGSLYFLSIRNLINMPFLAALGPITPLGGICFVLGWITLALKFFKHEF